MTPVFRHGWALGPGLWDGVRAKVGGVALDRGYFAPADEAVPAGPLLLVGHSLGALLWLDALPPAARGLVIVNGFDRLAAAGGWPGVPVRVLDRMRTRLRGDPLPVVVEFRARLGLGPPLSNLLDTGRLAADLDRLAGADERPAVAALRIPLLVLDGEEDPIVPPALRPLLFAGAERVTRFSRSGGHLLPATDPAWCAEKIAAFAATLA